MKHARSFNKLIQEGIFFLLLGAGLLWYSLNFYNQSFNKDWSQSPYLFPMLVAVIFGILAVSLLVQGVKKWGNESLEAAAEKKNSGRILEVLVILGISLLYYLAMAVLKIPYITFGILSWSFTVSNFEVLTLIFLAAMMLYLGVRKIAVLVIVPVGATLFLSIVFRALLHVLLP